MDSPSYEMKLQSKTDRGKEIYKFLSADGVTSKNSFREPELALADNVQPEPDDDVLVAQAGYGVLPVIIGDQAPKGTVKAVNNSDRAYQLTGINLKENDIENATNLKLGLYKEIDRKYNKIIYAPQGYEPVKVVKNRINHLIDHLEEHGDLYIAGKKTNGINRYKSHLQSQTGETKKLTQEGKQRIYRYNKTENFEPEQLEIETEFTAELDNLELDITACEGLFSPKQLDAGSKLLIEHIDLSEQDQVLDLACGYGIVGIFLQKKNGVELYLTDDNATATHYAEKNLKANNVENYILKNKDCLDGFKNQKFDAIVSNPPTHQGENITREMFEQSYKSLRKGGELYLVYNQNMKFRQQLTDFEETEILAEKDNYRVLKATK